MGWITCLGLGKLRNARKILVEKSLMESSFRGLRRSGTKMRRKRRLQLLKCDAVQLDRRKRKFRKNLFSPSSEYVYTKGRYLQNVEMYL